MTMNRRTAIAGIATLPFAVPFGAGDLGRQAAGGGWTSLFNGRDLTGWETFLGKPHKTSDVPGLARNEQGEYSAHVGVGRDPTRVFSIVDIEGGPAIRISGEIFGALTTLAPFGDYHLRFEFRWGETRWPPRETAIRDSGCCYRAVGPHGASYGFWMRSCEFQIQEGDCGDFYGLAGAIVDAEASRADGSGPKSDPVYRLGAPPMVGITKRIVRSVDSEKPRGAWNTMELYCVGQRSAHVVNGTVNMRLSGIRQPLDGREVPLTSGRIQFQSEGAEVFYRNIAIRAIDRIPSTVSG
jgi:hypothetical protein